MTALEETTARGLGWSVDVHETGAFVVVDDAQAGALEGAMQHLAQWGPLTDWLGQWHGTDCNGMDLWTFELAVT